MSGLLAPVTHPRVVTFWQKAGLEMRSLSDTITVSDMSLNYISTLVVRDKEALYA
jgi:hypothetical protein